MAIRPIRIIGDPVLRTVCDPITEITPNVKALVEDQIGVSLRAFSWNIDGEIGYVLNPRIVALSEDEYQDGDEGCLSVPELWYPTERAWYARCEGTDLDGKKVVVEGEELMARCIQHECDHLDGHIYIDRLDRATRKKALRDIRNAGF